MPEAVGKKEQAVHLEGDQVAGRLLRSKDSSRGGTSERGPNNLPRAVRCSFCVSRRHGDDGDDAGAVTQAGVVRRDGSARNAGRAGASVAEEESLARGAGSCREPTRLRRFRTGREEVPLHPNLTPAPFVPAEVSIPMAFASSRFSEAGGRGRPS